MSDIILKSKGFFKERLKKATRKCQTQMATHTELYLVALLEIRISSYYLFDTCEETGKPKHKILAEKYISFLNAEKKSQKEHFLKDLADSSLYMLGFFNNCLQKTLMGANYYTQMGTTAYHMLSHLSESSQTETYKELYEKFTPFTTVFKCLKNELAMEKGENEALIIPGASEEKKTPCLSSPPSSIKKKPC